MPVPVYYLDWFSDNSMKLLVFLALGETWMVDWVHQQTQWQRQTYDPKRESNNPHNNKIEIYQELHTQPSLRRAIG